MRHIALVITLASLCLVGILGCGGNAQAKRPHSLRQPLAPSGTIVFPLHIHGHGTHRRLVLEKKPRRGGPPRLAGASAPVVGQVLTTTSGTWANNPTIFSYQWQRCTGGTCTNIGGATGTSYTIVNADLGDTIVVVVTATNAGGSTSKASAPTGVVTGGVTCALYAATTGSDTTGSGSLASPYATVGKLETSLSAGQIGCLQPGTYGSITGTSPTTLATSGTASSPVTITSANPSSPATIRGWFTVNANYLTIQDVNIDGSNQGFAGPNPCGGTNLSQAFNLEGTGDVIQYVDFTQSTGPGNAFGIGFSGSGHGDNAIIRYSAIHDVGACQAYDHLIYLSHGSNVQIYDNWMWNDAHGFGVQVYPCPNGASIHSNVVDHAITGFVEESDSGCTLSNNTITNNVVSNSVGNSFAGTTGQGILTCCGSSLVNDTFTANDVWNNPGGVGSGATGLTVSGNITSDPLFVNAAAHNFAVQSGSPAASYGLPTVVGPSASP